MASKHASFFFADDSSCVSEFQRKTRLTITTASDPEGDQDGKEHKNESASTTALDFEENIRLQNSKEGELREVRRREIAFACL